MNKEKKILVIYNPHAGRIRPWALSTIKKNFKRLRVNYKLVNLDKKRLHNISFNKIDLIIVAGGDGTIRDVAEILYKKGLDIPIAIIPIGSANILAYSLGIPWNIKKALKFALSQPIQKIDAGLVNKQHLFLIGLSVGLDAKVIGRTPRHWKKIYGVFAYFISALRFVFSDVEYSFRLKLDQKKIYYKAASIIILNNGNFFGFPLAPAVSLIDGKLNIVVIHTSKFRKLVSMFYKLIRKKFSHLHDDISYSLAKTVEISFKENIEIEIDGEEFDLNEINVKILPKQISVIAKKSRIYDTNDETI